MDVVIRSGELADAEALAELAERTFRETFEADNRPEDIALYISQTYGPAQQRQELADANISTFLTHAAGELVAFAQLRREPAPDCVAGEAPIELLRFYVAREWHGRGLAQLLMRRVENAAAAVGAQTLWLGVWERNERAKSFYRKCGFADVGTHVFMLGTDAQTDRIMAKVIGSSPASLPRQRNARERRGDAF